MSVDKLSHVVWECKYHIVFVPKYRYKIITSSFLKNQYIIV